MTTPTENLTDEIHYGENLLAIANRAFVLAPQLCSDCMIYHMRVPATRAVGLGASLEMDRRLIVETLKAALSSPEISAREELTIAIIGSADTGLLATCAHAVATMGHAILAKTKFIVADLCPTPLALCREFASLHGLNLETMALNFVTDRFEHPADIIFMHSILRFIPFHERTKLLNRLALQLRPSGKLIISNMFHGERKVCLTKIDPRRQLALQKILAFIQSGQLKINQSLATLAPLLEESFLATQNRDVAIESLASARALFEDAGLSIERAEINELQLEDETGIIHRQRLLAVLAQK